jgi:hypothetical protein
MRNAPEMRVSCLQNEVNLSADAPEMRVSRVLQEMGVSWVN